MRAIPNMTVISPADAYEAYAATLAIADYDGPVYMRLGRADMPVLFDEDVTFEIGKAKKLRSGTDVTLIGTGQMVSLCMDAAEMLEQAGVSAEVINVSTIKPLDIETIYESVSKTGCVVTAEEHSVIGGLGSAVAEFLSENYPCPITRVGTRDTFGESGNPDELFKKYGLTAEDIRDAAELSIKKKE